MRKRICNKVLLKFISVGAFFWGGGRGEEDWEAAFLACFFFGWGRGWGSFLSRMLFWGGGEGMGKLPVSHPFFGGGGGGVGEGACLTYQELKPFALLL